MGKKMKILIVEDEMVSRTKLKLIMENFGECSAVENGEDGVAVFYKALEGGKPFGLVMLDIDMPQMDGMQVLSEMIDAQIRCDVSKSQRAKILMVTSFTDKDRVLGCIQSGCDDYIAKPFDIDTIGKKLSKLGIRPHKVQSEKADAAVMPSDDSSSSHFIDGIVTAFDGKKINLPTVKGLSQNTKLLNKQNAPLTRATADMAVRQRRWHPFAIQIAQFGHEKIRFEFNLK